MASDIDLELFERNDHVIFLDFDEPITGLGVEFVIKDDYVAEDIDGHVFSTANGEITVTDATGGKAEVKVDSSHTQKPVKQVCRADLLDDGERRTAMIGPLEVLPT